MREKSARGGALIRPAENSVEKGGEEVIWGDSPIRRNRVFTQRGLPRNLVRADTKKRRASW